MMKVAVSSYSFSQAYRDGRITLFDSIAKAKEMGFDGFEVVDFNFKTACPEGKTLEEYAAELKAEADRVGIVITNYTVGADFQNRDTAEEVERVKKEVDIAVILGASGMRHDAASWDRSKKYESFDHALPRMADGIRQVAEYAASKGIRTMSENHGFFAQDALRVEKLMNAVGHPNYGWLVDMGNFTCADENPFTSVGIAAPYAVYVHAKDFIIKPADGPNPGRFFFKSRGGAFLRGTIVGQGNVPVKACLAALKNNGYDGFVAIEFEGMEDCFLALEAGLENLRRYIRELED
ncbi:MAG: sugar phosphate isomerase/epimerase [Firmicutes bacterium]|nr:sugar phosphate isomerase/epimerase [Bacillota bacterium]